MSEKDSEADEVSTVAPEDTAPAVENERQPEACADLAQVTGSLGTQTPPLRGPEIPVSTGVTGM